MTHEERADTALRALGNSGFNGMAHEDLADSIVDLVTNLLHLAVEYGIEPDYVIHCATMHYDAEVEERAASNP